MSEGHSDLLLEEFIQYLVSISSKSSSLLREKYADVFEALKTARGPESRETHEDRLAQMLVEIQEGQQTDSEVESEDPRRDIDLMARDNEDHKEEIESENEEERAFLNDVTEDQEDVSFYRRFYVELDRGIRQEHRLQRQELAIYEDLLSGQEQTSDNKGLIQLEEKTERLYTRTASAGFQFWEVQPECHQRIPVPLVNQASSYHCEPIAIKYGKTFGVWPVYGFNTPAWTATVEP